MNIDTLFQIANLSVLPGWAVLMFAPRWRLGNRLIATVIIPGLLGLLYVYLMVSNLGSAEGGGFGSLEAIGTLFAQPALLFAGWVHYLAFDLFIGAWEVRDATRLEIPHWAVVPCLVLTFMAGPAGLLLYFLVRALFNRRVALGENASPGGT